MGIATDGSEYTAHIVTNGMLEQVSAFKASMSDPYSLLRWLESIVVVSDDLPLDAQVLKQEVGRESVAYARAARDIERIWAELSDSSQRSPEVHLKRDLWNRLLQIAYGSDVDDNLLFFQHTYLTIVAKTIATMAIIERLPERGDLLLDGKLFRDQGIYGAVESDFFDWILLHPQGESIVMRIANHVSRFRLANIDVDILKALYESLIDPKQRHDLGEYYTPDWLAQRICAAAIDAPLEQRIIDPACGSGTFLFHAVRRVIDAVKQQKLGNITAWKVVLEKIAGIDVHPVAVIFSRVTFLLALLGIKDDRPASINVPVYLGDALQWNAQTFMGVGDLEIVVPSERGGMKSELRGKLPDEDDAKRAILRFPTRVATDPAIFDSLLEQMLELSASARPSSQFVSWLKARGVGSGADLDVLVQTFEALKNLHKEGRNHIWGYVARNLSRPIWLAAETQKFDVIIGNPPWVAYGRMVSSIQKQFKGRMEEAGIWGGMQSVSAFDLSSYFFIRSLQLYGRKKAKIAFILPYAAMFKKPYAKFRSGVSVGPSGARTFFKVTAGWALRSDVQPLFPVPACVFFATRSHTEARKLPNEISRFSGQLSKRDALEEEANKSIAVTIGRWPAADTNEGGSIYREQFRQGAILVPRRFVLVERKSAGKFSSSAAAPYVRGRVGKLDKEPWSKVTPPEGSVESEFIYAALLGESIVPYRIIRKFEAVIPLDASYNSIMNSVAARKRGFDKLSRWVGDIEKLFSTVRQTAGRDAGDFTSQIDFFEQLSSQFPLKKNRIVYAKGGSIPAAAVVLDSNAVIDHKLYWAAVPSEEEAYYLSAVLNSEALRERIEDFQAEGQQGARDFDKVVWNIAIPRYSSKERLHREIADAAVVAGGVANRVEVLEIEDFKKTRRRVREALIDDGVGVRIETLVSRLISDL